MWTTGENKYGQLGDESAMTKRTFGRVISAEVEGIAAGYDHSIVLKLHGSVWVTGRNNFGQLGQGQRPYRRVFTKAISGSIKAVAAGDWHSMALAHDGNLWATGANGYGQLGDGSTIGRDRFTTVLRDGSCFMLDLMSRIFDLCYHATCSSGFRFFRDIWRINHAYVI